MSVILPFLLLDAEARRIVEAAMADIDLALADLQAAVGEAGTRVSGNLATLHDQITVLETDAGAAVKMEAVGEALVALVAAVNAVGTA